MKTCRFRGISVGLFLLLIICSTCFTAFGCTGIWYLVRGAFPKELNIFLGVFLVLFTAGGLILITMACCQYFSICSIEDKKITYSGVFRKNVMIEKGNLSFFGCAAYVARGEMLFFTSRSFEEIFEFVQEKNPDYRKIYYRQETTERLKDSEEGLRELVIGSYIYYCVRKPEKNTIIIPSCSAKQLFSVVEILQKDALLVGPWMLQCADEWRPYALFGRQGDGLREP